MPQRTQHSSDSIHPFAGLPVPGRDVRWLPPGAGTARPEVIVAPYPVAAPARAEQPEAAAIRDALKPTIFHERWWLDIVTRGAYAEVEVRDQGRVVGRLPYARSRRHGLRVSTMPQLTHTLGPAVDEGKGSMNTRALNRLRIMQELAGCLPDVSYFEQTCWSGIGDVLGFQARGFDVAAQFTMTIEADTEARLWAGMRDKTRNVIRRAQERVAVEDLQDPQEFTRFYARNLHAVGKHSYFDLSRVAPLIVASRERDQGRVVGCRDGSGALVAAIFYIWNGRSASYFLSTRDGSADNGAVSLLVWEAVRAASARGLSFDFDGVASLGAAQFFVGFGGRPAPRYVIVRATRSYAAARSVVAWIRRKGKQNYFTDV